MAGWGERRLQVRCTRLPGSDERAGSPAKGSSGGSRIPVLSRAASSSPRCAYAPGHIALRRGSCQGVERNRSAGPSYRKKEGRDPCEPLPENSGRTARKMQNARISLPNSLKVTLEVEAIFAPRRRASLPSHCSESRQIHAHAPDHRRLRRMVRQCQGPTTHLSRLLQRRQPARRRRGRSATASQIAWRG
jgi:hypothetical protein